MALPCPGCGKPLGLTIEFIMKNNIHESIYDISQYIYFLLEGNMYSDEKKLIYDLNNFIDILEEA